MIVSKCPLRVSLVGGSTDLQAFLNRYSRGSVIGFPSTLYAYIFLNKKHGSDHRIVYSKIEDVKAHQPKTIQNDIVRESLHFLYHKYGALLFPSEIIFESDIPSTGSGLASSSAYTIAFLNAVNLNLNIGMSPMELCEAAVEVERKFNPLVGYQDIYQSGLPGFKRLNFNEGGLSSVIPLPTKILRNLSMYLIPTKKTRSSTSILKTLDLASCLKLLPQVGRLETAINNDRVNDFLDCINDGWEEKKRTSPEIMNSEVNEVEEWIDRCEGVKARRLCGAGGGGYFLVITDPDCSAGLRIDGYRINVAEEGPTAKFI